MSDACYYFSPAVRRGLASAITANATKSRAVIQVRAQLTASGAGEETKEVVREIELYGPGDILGFNAQAVARTDPRPHVGDFEPNHVATIDFFDPDFPWRFSPMAPAGGRITPWIALLVLEQGEFTVASEKEKGDPTSIAVRKGCLPDLATAALWAHVQLTGKDGGTPTAGAHALELNRIEETAPQNVVSRLICPRRLKPATSYRAFVVPAFKQGCVAAGLTTMEKTEDPLTFAWKAGGEATLPSYYSWEFHTGERGDFEYLVRILQPRALTGLGVRPIDCSHPGYGIPPVERAGGVLEMEGALQSLDTRFSPWGKDRPGDPAPFQKELAEKLLNKNASTPVPSVVPPIYGSWFAGRKTVNLAANHWLDELNLDPRHRAAAAIGALIVEHQKEPLMASAWKQLDQIEKANAVLRHGQFGREASSGLHERLKVIPIPHLLLMTVSLHPQVKEKEQTLATRLASSPIPVALLDPALRRLRVSPGPAAKQPAKDKAHLLERMNGGAIATASAHPKPAGQVSLRDQQHITSSMLKQELSAPGAQAKMPKGVQLSELRDAACHMLDVLSKPAAKPKAEQKAPRHLDLADVGQTLIEALDPRETIENEVLARVQVQLPQGAPKLRDREDPLGPLHLSPQFPQPMYEALREISQDLILPGVETVPENTVAVLKTNRRFLEAFMVGLNHAFTGELLWRGAPVGGRFTYFRQFWDVSQALAAQHPADQEAEHKVREELKDIPPITSWGKSRLGEHDNRKGEHAESLVLMVRGALLRKHPNTLLYAVEAVKGSDGKRLPGLAEFGVTAKERLAPTFHGSLAPDLTFFGFNFTEKEARGGEGSKYPDGVFFVLEERPGEARFGLDEPVAGSAPAQAESWEHFTWGHAGVAPGEYLGGTSSGKPKNPGGLGWGKSSAMMASILLRKAARIAVHAERLLPVHHKALPPKGLKAAVSKPSPAAQTTISDPEWTAQPAASEPESTAQATISAPTKPAPLPGPPPYKPPPIKR